MVSETEKELFKLIGKYEAQSKNTEKHLESIDKRLEKGDTSMQNLDTKIERNFSEQKLIVSQCQGSQDRKHDAMNKKLQEIENSFEKHKRKPHIYHQSGADGRLGRVKRHWLEILLSGIATAIVGGIIAYINSIGVTI